MSIREKIMFEKRDCMIIPVSNSLLYEGNLIELSAEALLKDRETHSPPRHDIVFDLAKC